MKNIFIDINIIENTNPQSVKDCYINYLSIKKPNRFQATYRGCGTVSGESHPTLSPLARERVKGKISKTTDQAANRSFSSSSTFWAATGITVPGPKMAAAPCVLR